MPFCQPAPLYATGDPEWHRDGVSLGAGSNDLSVTQSGTYSLLIRHPDGDIMTDSVQVWIRSTFDQWRQQQFSPAELEDPDISGPHADPNGMGWPNLLRFALLPEEDRAGPITPPDLLAGGLTSSAFSYIRPKQAGKIEYIEEASTDLLEWNPISHETYRWIEDLGESERVTVALPPEDEGSAVAFYRLQVNVIE